MSNTYTDYCFGQGIGKRSIIRFKYCWADNSGELFEITFHSKNGMNTVKFTPEFLISIGVINMENLAKLLNKVK